MSNFNVIKEIAKQKNISIRELSSRIGKDETTLQAIFRNGSTNTRTIEDIAKVLDVPVGVFFDKSSPSITQNGGERNAASIYGNASTQGDVKDVEIACLKQLLKEKDKQIQLLWKLCGMETIPTSQNDGEFERQFYLSLQAFVDVHNGNRVDEPPVFEKIDKLMKSKDWRPKFEIKELDEMIDLVGPIVSNKEASDIYKFLVSLRKKKDKQ